MINHDPIKDRIMIVQYLQSGDEVCVNFSTPSTFDTSIKYIKALAFGNHSMPQIDFTLFLNKVTTIINITPAQL